VKLKKTSTKRPSLNRLKPVKQADPSTDLTQERNDAPETSQKRGDIREIVDYNRPFNIFYSGVEDKTNFDILYDMGIRNFLMSYHYIQNKHLDTKAYESAGVKFFIDSGAYTYMSDMKYQDTSIEEWEKHIQRYLRWAKKHKDMIFAIANLDLENMLGVEIVREWNEKYFEPFMLETGIPVCFIWHPIDGDQGWERYCQRYPYVGMSWVSDDGTDLDFNFGQSMLRVAEKYNSVVHGMGMTRTALLTKLSFYTSDSTTWLVGLQYGEINYWNGQKMQRLKKEKWKSSYLPVICDKFGLDPERLEQEDMEEMIRANVGAFIEAEAFIHQMAKSRFYWMKAKKKKRTGLDDVDFPSVEWLKGETSYDEWEHYAEELNISRELDQNAVINLIIDTTLFALMDTEPYTTSFNNTYTDDAVIKEIHDEWVNRIVSSVDDMILDLHRFFVDVVMGVEERLLHLGTNFDRTVKERDTYICDDEYEDEDVPDIEVQNVLSKYLPPPKEGSPAPEISDLDDEIFREQGIEPIRDANGRFLKGQRQVLKPKKLYSEKYPKMSCDRCVNAQVCPEYKPGFVCAFNKMFQRYNTRDMADIIQAMQGIVDLSMQRLQRSMMTEVLNGGMPDPNLSQMMNQSMNLLGQLQRMYEVGSQEVIRQTRVLRADGTQEMTTQVSNPQSGGILAQIFGNLSSTREEVPDEDDVIEAEAVTVDPKEE